MHILIKLIYYFTAIILILEGKQKDLHSFSKGVVNEEELKQLKEKAFTFSELSNYVLSKLLFTYYMRSHISKNVMFKFRNTPWIKAVDYEPSWI